MVKYKLKPLATAALSSALIVSSLSGFATTADAATKVQKVKNVKIKKGKLVKKSNGKVIKGYVSYKGVIYKDGKVFTGVLNKAYYKKGKKATGLYKSKYYKNGALGTGIYKNHYYKAGSLGTGTYKGKKYAKGKLFTGLSGKTYYKAGVLGTGNYKNKKYVKGKLFTGLSGKTYYKNGVLGTGSHEGHYYVKGKLATGEFGGILYEAGKPFTGEKDGIFYKDGKKDEDQTNVANFKKAEAEVQKANDAFKKAKEQKDALDALAKKAGVSTQANLQTKNAADIDAFLAKYKDVDVSKLEGAELTEFKSALATNLTLATENLKTASTNVTNAVNTFVAAASVIASTTDDALLAHIKTAVATATTVVASLKAAGYDTVQLENVLSKLPGGSTGGGNNNGGGSNTGGGSTGGGNTGGGSTGGGSTGGGNTGGGETETEISTKVKAVTDAQAEVTAAQAKLDELLAQQKVTLGKLVKRDAGPTLVDQIADARAKLTDATSKLLDAIKSLGTANLSDPQKAAVQTAALLATSAVADIVKNAPEDDKDAQALVQALKEKLDKLPANTKPSKADEIKLVTAQVNALLNGEELAKDVTQAKISEAKKLVGTLDEDKDGITTKADLLAKVKKAQGLLDKQIAADNEAKLQAATDAVNALLNGEALAKDVTQKQITDAKALVDALPEDAVGKGTLSTNVGKAQTLLTNAITTATTTVDELFATKQVEGNTVPDYDTLAEGVTQKQITDAKALVEALPEDAVGKGTLSTNVGKAQTLLTNAITTATTTVDELFATKQVEGNTVPDYDTLAERVTQDQITHAKDLVDALPKDAEGKETLTTNVGKAQALFTEQEDKTEADKVTAATEAVKALFTDEDKTVIKESTDEKAIADAEKLVKALPENTEGLKDLKDAIASAKDKLKAITDKYDANKGLQTDGSLAVKGNFNTIDEAGFTFQMAGIALVKESEIEKVTAFDRNAIGNTLKEAKTLTTAQMNEGIRLTLERINAAKPVTLNEKDPSLNIVPSQKHGYTVFTVNANNFSKEIFDKLDGNKNNAYLITVNDKSTSTKAYKILFQVIDGKVEAKFVESDIKDADFTVKNQVDALFTDDSKATLKNEVTEETIKKVETAVETIANTKLKEALKADLTKASDLLKKEIAELQNGFQDDGSLAVKGENVNFDDVFTFQMAGIALVKESEIEKVTAFDRKAIDNTLKEAKTLTTAQMNKGILATLERINAAKLATSENGVPSLAIKSSQKHGYTVFTVNANNFSKENFDKLDGPEVIGDNYYTNRYNITVNPKSPSTGAPFILKLSSDDKGTVNATFEAKRGKTK